MSNIDAAISRSLFELYRAGAFSELAEETRSLLADHPRELVLHTLLGAACLELGEYDAAIGSYQAALAIRPGFAKAHNSLGIVYLRSGRLREAAASFRNAIENDLRFAEPRFNLGIVYENGQRLKDAAEQYEQAVALDPGYFKAWSALAKVCWELGEYGRVAGHYRRALAGDDKYLPAHRGLMQFLEQSNRREELRDAVAAAHAALGTDHPLVRFQEGVIAATEGGHWKARALLEGFRFESSDTTALHDERMRLTHLAGICDRLDDTRNAMRHAADANRLSRQLSDGKGIDKTRFLGFVENRERYFRRDNIRLWRLERPDSEGKGPGGEGAGLQPAAMPANPARPVFIIGFPRSGTTLIDTMLRGHPQIDVAEESDAVPAMVNRLSGASDADLASLGALSAGAIESAAATYYDRLRRHVQPSAANATIIDRFALNIVYAGEILRVFPAARFIIVLRHPADCVLSCYLRSFTETSANASFHTLEEAAFLYDQVFSLWKRFTEVLALNTIEVRYEDLVENVERTCRPVLEFIGLTWHAGILDHERTARSRPYIRTASYDQVIEPVYSRASGRWLRYREYLEPVLPTLQPWIDRFGYAKTPPPGSSARA